MSRWLSSLREAGTSIPRPWLVVGAAAVIAAIAFSSVAAGTVGVLILAAFAGVGIATAWRRRPLVVSDRAAGWLALAVVAIASAYIFVPAFERSLLWVKGDWGPQDAVLRGVVDHMKHFELPHWNHLVSTGDATIDLYPAMTYVIAGAVAIVGGFESNLPFVLVLLAVIAHTLIAINATRLALRFLPAPIAAVIGLALVIDNGSVSSGGVIGTIENGLLHSAVAQVFALSAAVAVVDALQRPRLSCSIQIWIWTALACAAHPAGLLSTLVTCVALGAVALLARDVPPRRAVVAIGHVLLGVALGAFVWMPLAQRLVMYGQHFSDVLVDPRHWLTNLMSSPIPVGSFAFLVYVGYAGSLATLWSRKATGVFIAATVIVMVVATSDAPYLAFDLAPSQFTARIGAMRFYGLVRPFVFVASGAIFALALAHVRDRWRGATGRAFITGAAIAGMLGAVGVHLAGRAAHQMIADVRQMSSLRALGTDELLEWSKQQAREARPERWGRAIVVNTFAYYSHATSLAGLPAFHLGPIPDILMRERIEDDSAESLRRFNVRWILTDSAAPFGVGDPATEKTLGRFRVRELASWDGKFARIERGTGNAVVTRLDDDAVEVDLRDTTEPALVALGMGYYPRWRAVGPDGKPVQVLAYPATSRGLRFVPAAWLPPGKTVFRPNGSLPSDGAGRPFTLAALVWAIAAVVVWSRRRWRWKALRGIARARAIPLPSAVPMAAAIGGSLVLIAWGVVASRAPVRAIQVDGDATISYNASSGWQACSHSRTLGEFHCADRAVVFDTTDAIVNDGQIMWPFTTPAIAVLPTGGSSVQVRVKVTRRLAGRYWVGVRNAQVDFTLDGATSKLSEQRIVELADGEHTIEITGPRTTQPLWFTFVREDTLLPDRTIPLAPGAFLPR